MESVGLFFSVFLATITFSFLHSVRKDAKRINKIENIILKKNLVELDENDIKIIIASLRKPALEFTKIDNVVKYFK